MRDPGRVNRYFSCLSVSNIDDKKALADGHHKCRFGNDLPYRLSRTSTGWARHMNEGYLLFDDLWANGPFGASGFESLELYVVIVVSEGSSTLVLAVCDWEVWYSLQ